MSIEDRFDIEKVTQIFQESLQEDDDVLMEHYIQAYREINKFFLLMGTIFGFVSNDVRAKINILDEMRHKEEQKENFVTIKTMITYEKEAGLIRQNGYVSGSRTLLRLHRGLAFVHEFLKRIAELNECDKLNDIGKAAYNDTLAKHHTWVIRKGALCAMYALPTQGELLKRVGVNPIRAIEVLPEMLKYTKDVYDRTDKLYDLFDIKLLV